jgi:hypothetical protein
VSASPSGTHCSCGCALASWSMPWPVDAAPWSPAVVHDTAPVAAALFPWNDADPDLVDVTAADLDLVDADYLAPVLDVDAVDPAVLRTLRRAS